MRIGLDARMYRSGVAGIGRYCQNLIKNLLAIDKENQYVLFMTSVDKKEFENSLKIAFSRPNYKLPLGIKIVIADIPHFSLAEQAKLPKILEKENLDLVHFLNFNHPVRYGGRYITTIHDLTLLFYPQTAKNTNFLKNFGFRYVMKNALENSAKIIAISESTKKDIVKKFQIRQLADKIQTIYEAADDKVFQNTDLKAIENLKEKYHLDSPIILYVGQFRYHKNIKGLLEAFEIVRREKPLKLVLLGKSESGSEFKNLLDKSAFKSDIIMPGFVSDKELANWYNLARVFVFPSFYEGFGLPGLEAMQAGTPVVASNCSSLPEIYKDAAVYFDPYDTADIADKIEEVMENDSLRRDLIENGQKVSSQYSWKKTAEETLDLYRQIQK